MEARKACNGCGPVSRRAGLPFQPSASFLPTTANDHLEMHPKPRDWKTVCQRHNPNGHRRQNQSHPRFQGRLTPNGLENEPCLLKDQSCLRLSPPRSRLDAILTLSWQRRHLEWPSHPCLLHHLRLKLCKTLMMIWIWTKTTLRNRKRNTTERGLVWRPNVWI